VKNLRCVFDMAKYDLSFPANICNYDYPKGWNKLIEDLIKDLDELDPNYTISQIKEKFGGLRFYVHDATTDHYMLINKAEGKSLFICQVCGKEGRTQNKNGWLMTVCNEHSIEYGEDKED